MLSRVPIGSARTSTGRMCWKTVIPARTRPRVAGSTARWPPFLRAVTDKELGVALGQNVPLVMRGPAAVTSWSPSKLAALDDDTLERITDLYSGDPLLAKRLADALAADAIADPPMTMLAA